MSSLLLSVFFQAESGIRDLGRSRGLGDVYKCPGLLAPLVLLAAVVAFSEDTRARVRTTVLLAVALVYPLGVAAWVLTTSSGVLGSDSSGHNLYAPSSCPLYTLYAAALLAR